MDPILTPLAICIIALIGAGAIISGSRNRGQMTTARQASLDSVLRTIRDPEKLKQLASVFEGEGLPTQGGMLRVRAAYYAMTPAQKKERRRIFQKAIVCNDPDAIEKVAAAFASCGATKAARNLRIRANSLRNGIAPPPAEAVPQDRPRTDGPLGTPDVQYDPHRSGNDPSPDASAADATGHAPEDFSGTGLSPDEIANMQAARRSAMDQGDFNPAWDYASAKLNEFVDPDALGGLADPQGAHANPNPGGRAGIGYDAGMGFTPRGLAQLTRLEQESQGPDLRSVRDDMGLEGRGGVPRRDVLDGAHGNPFGRDGFGAHGGGGGGRPAGPIGPRPGNSTSLSGRQAREFARHEGGGEGVEGFREGFREGGPFVPTAFVDEEAYFDAPEAPEDDAEPVIYANEAPEVFALRHNAWLRGRGRGRFRGDAAPGADFGFIAPPRLRGRGWARDERYVPQPLPPDGGIPDEPQILANEAPEAFALRHRRWEEMHRRLGHFRGDVGLDLGHVLRDVAEGPVGIIADLTRHPNESDADWERRRRFEYERRTKMGWRPRRPRIGADEGGPANGEGRDVRAIRARIQRTTEGLASLHDQLSQAKEMALSQSGAVVAPLDDFQVRALNQQIHQAQQQIGYLQSALDEAIGEALPPPSPDEATDTPAPPPPFSPTTGDPLAAPPTPGTSAVHGPSGLIIAAQGQARAILDAMDGDQRAHLLSLAESLRTRADADVLVANGYTKDQVRAALIALGRTLTEA